MKAKNAFLFWSCIVSLKCNSCTLLFSTLLFGKILFPNMRGGCDKEEGIGRRVVRPRPIPSGSSNFFLFFVLYAPSFLNIFGNLFGLSLRKFIGVVWPLSGWVWVLALFFLYSQCWKQPSSAAFFRTFSELIIWPTNVDSFSLINFPFSMQVVIITFSAGLLEQNVVFLPFRILKGSFVISFFLL